MRWRALRSVVGLALGCCVLPAVVLAQLPPPPPPPLPVPSGVPRDAAKELTGTARLSGRVTALDTGRPIRRAEVRATSAEMRQSKTISTDADGRWALRDLPAGRYTVIVSKGGFVSLSYGQKRPFETGKTIELGEGQSLDRLDTALPRGSAVSGGVVDEFGDPVMGARVSAMRYKYQLGARRLTSPGVSDTTDDLGRYRLHGLPPGDYYVSAQVSTVGFLASEDRTGYATAYHPGTLNPSEATRLTLAVAQELQNVVVQLTPTRLAKLSGTATNSHGKPIVEGLITLRDPARVGGMFGSAGRIQNGAWSISGVVPGDYTLMLQFVGSLEQVAVTGGIGPRAEIAMMPINVTGEDVSGIAVVSVAAGVAKGHVRYEGGAAPPPAGSGVTMMAMDLSVVAGTAASSGRVRPDGSFEITGLLGPQMLRPFGLPRGWYLKAITYNGADVTDAPIQIHAGQTAADIDVLLTQRAADVSGMVTDPKGNAVLDYVVVLFPPEADKWDWQSRFVRTARPDQTGRFTVAGMPAGTYLVVALDYVEPGEESNPEFLEKLKTAATTIRVVEGDKKSVSLKLSSQ